MSIQDSLICYMPLQTSDALIVGAGAAITTRSTTGTYLASATGIIDTAAINTGRFESNGRLIEAASTNLCLDNEDLTSGSWSKTSMTIDGDANAAPDGNVTGDMMVESVATAQHVIKQTISVAAASDITISSFLKGDGRRYVSIFPQKTGTVPSSTYAVFDLLDGIVTATGAGITAGSAKMVDYGGGWFRCELGFLSAAAGGVIYHNYLSTSGSSPAPVYEGDGVSGISSWGTQVGELFFPPSYTPTDGSAVTRAEDSLSIDASNIPAPASDYSVSLKATLKGLDPSISQVLFNVDGETSRRIEWNTSTGAITATHGAATSTSTSTFAAGTEVYICLTVGATNQTLYIDSAQEDQDAKGAVTGTATDIDIGNQAGSNQAYSNINSFRIFNKELTAAEVVENATFVLGGVALTKSLTFDLTSPLTSNLTG